MLIFCHNDIVEFDKKANSYLCHCGCTRSHKVSLATIGVCVFCALASVGALFCFILIYKEMKLWEL